MRTEALMLVFVAALLAGWPAAGVAQGITITPAFGAFLPASDLRDLGEQAERRTLDRSAALGLGVNIDAGWVRGSVVYATEATLTDRGVDGGTDVGKSPVLAVAADYVWRPLARFLVQPYLLGGGGLKRQNYSYDDDELASIFPADRTDFTLHFGGGADMWFGRVGVMAEITDFLSRRPDDTFGQHDAFLMVGASVRL